jgi:hypothetical protein
MKTHHRYPSIIRLSFLLLLCTSLVITTSAQSYTSPAKAQEREEESLEHAKNIIIPTAESVYNSESIKIPPIVKSFIILIPNEAHENRG